MAKRRMGEKEIERERARESERESERRFGRQPAGIVEVTTPVVKCFDLLAE